MIVKILLETGAILVLISLCIGAVTYDPLSSIDWDDGEGQ